MSDTVVGKIEQLTARPAVGASELKDVVSRAHGRAVIAGRIEVVEEDGKNFKHNLGLVIVFDTTEQARKALMDGCCTFQFGDG